MNKKRPGSGGREKRDSRPSRPINKAGSRPRPQAGRPRPNAEDTFRIVERRPDRSAAPAESGGAPEKPSAFRVLIAVHRPRYRVRAERAAALVGWEVTALLNKQDAVGAVSKPPRPPDLLILSGDFGRQRDYAIFRAVQKWRSRGMKLIGMVDDCETPPEGFPDSAPEKLCDVCLTPPYKTADLRALFTRLYQEMRGEPAPPPIRIPAAAREPEEED
ncbi:MAG TPA: hypothetical protein VFB38_22455 [Chthonomonadaceae bacterium]|nr:hypothetical protein [Chthonomonadaceae bacterium]